MRFLSVRDIRSKSAQIWKDLTQEKEMVITNNGRPVAVIAAVSDTNLEETLAAFRKARAIEAVAGMQRRSVEQKTDQITMDEINTEIRTVRKKRPR